MKTRMPVLVAVLAAIAVLILAVPRVRSRPQYTSPPASVSAQIGGKQISIDYYAPSMHGRKVMGALVPYGEVWCTGANWATKITFATALQIGDLKLPAGSYSLWTIPNAKEWTLIVNKQTGQFHLDYDASRDFGRTKMTIKKLDAPVETFKIELRPGAGNQGTLALLWETTEASIPLTILPAAR